MNIKKWLIPLAFVLLLFLHLTRHRPVHHGPGVVAPDDPIQQESDSPSFEFRGVRMTPLADFSLSARLLSKESYSSGLEGDLSPWDFALGWGPMSDESILADIDISQSNRFYHWSVRSFPITRREIETHSANMHLIPADEEIEDQLDDIRVGQVVALNGQLVRIEGPNGWHWTSSLTRNDTGFGACELIFVTAVSVR